MNDKPQIINLAKRPLFPFELRKGSAWVKEKIRLGSQGAALKALLAAAVDDIAKQGAWPQDVGPYTIDIVHGGGMLTTAGNHQGWRDDPNEIFQIERLRVEVGVDLMASPMAAFFRAKQIPDATIAELFIAHEIFHIGEIKRQQDCGLPYRLAPSGFAKGIRPEMSTQWKDAARSLADHYKHHTRKAPKTVYAEFSPEAARANDTVFETCADLMALAIVSKGSAAHPQLAQALVDFRMENEAKGKDEYRSGWSSGAIFKANPQPSAEESIIATWQLALGELVAAPDVPADFAVKSAGLKLTLAPPAPAPAKPSPPAPGLLNKLVMR